MSGKHAQLLPFAWLQSLVEEPEMLALMTASPRLVRTMKPLCRALGVTIPKLPAPMPPAPALAGPGAGAKPVAGRVATGGQTAGSAAPAHGVAGGGVARFAAGDARFRK
jgi:hypothetical protein